MLAEALPPGGCRGPQRGGRVFRTASPRAPRRDAVFAGIEKGDVQARDLRPHFNGVRFTLHADGQAVEAELPVPGMHMVRNALLAVAVGRIFGLSLEECAAGLRELRAHQRAGSSRRSSAAFTSSTTPTTPIPTPSPPRCRRSRRCPPRAAASRCSARWASSAGSTENGHRRVGEAAGGRCDRLRHRRGPRGAVDHRDRLRRAGSKKWCSARTPTRP